MFKNIMRKVLKKDKLARRKNYASNFYTTIFIVAIVFVYAITLGYSSIQVSLKINGDIVLSPSVGCEANGKYYSSLQVAIDEINDSNEVVINMMKNSSDPIVIPNDRVIVLNSNGYTLNSNGTTITNNGKLKIINSTITSNGISSSDGDNYAIISNGQLEIINSDIKSLSGDSSYSASAIKTEGSSSLYIENSNIFGSKNGIVSSSSDSLIEIGKPDFLDDTTVVSGLEYAVNIPVDGSSFKFNSGLLEGEISPGYNSNAVALDGYYIIEYEEDSKYKVVVEPIVNVGIVATNINTLENVESDIWIKDGLKYSFNYGDNTTPVDGSLIYYCVDEDNSCNPDVLVDTSVEVSDYESKDGIYYVRYKVVVNNKFSSKIGSFKAKIDNEVPNSAIVTPSDSYDNNAPKLTFSLSGDDLLSGVSKFELYYKDNDAEEYTMETFNVGEDELNYTIDAVGGGGYSYYVIVYDKLNNSLESVVESFTMKVYGENGDACGYTYGEYTSIVTTDVATCTPVLETDTGTTYKTCLLDSDWTKTGSSSVAYNNCTASESETKKVTCSSTSWTCGSWSTSTTTSKTKVSTGTAPSSCTTSSQSYVTACTVSKYLCTCQSGTIRKQYYGTSACSSSACASSYGTGWYLGSSSVSEYKVTKKSRTNTGKKTKTTYQKYYTVEDFTRTKTPNTCWYR